MARTYRNPRMDNPIDRLMEFDHVVAVMPDGRVIDVDEQFNLIDEYAPEVYIDYEGPFADAQISNENDRDMVQYLKSQGWEVLTGYSGQQGYSGPIMHTSEFIGGGLADRIREEPGYWVALTVELHPKDDDPEHEDNGGSGESEAAGWIVARKIGSEDEIAARTKWIAEDIAPWDMDPDYKRTPMSDEDAQFSQPVVIREADDESTVRMALVTRIHQYSQYSHIKQAGMTDRYLAAADMIAEGEYKVKPAYRVFRVRARLMPKEDNK